MASLICSMKMEHQSSREDRSFCPPPLSSTCSFASPTCPKNGSRTVLRHATSAIGYRRLLSSTVKGRSERQTRKAVTRRLCWICVHTCSTPKTPPMPTTFQRQWSTMNLSRKKRSRSSRTRRATSYSNASRTKLIEARN